MAQRVTTEHHLSHCYLCWKEYKDPQKLSCGHMFCCQCLHNVIVSLARRSISIEVSCVLECPICYLRTDKGNEEFQLAPTKTMKPLSISTTNDYPDNQRSVSVSSSMTKANADGWLGRNIASKTTSDHPGINEMCFHAYPPSPKHDRLPIGWALSSHEGGAVHVPRKLYKDSNTSPESFFFRQDTGSCETSNSSSEYKAKDCHLTENPDDSRERHFLNSLEFAEIKFLQPDSTQEGPNRYQIGYEEEHEEKPDAYYQSTSENYTNPPLRTTHKPTSEDKPHRDSQNTTSNEKFKNHMNGIIYIQNSKYKRVNPVSAKTITQNSRYTKGSYSYGSLQVLSSGRQQFSGKIQSASTCKCHPEQTASLYCTSCQLQTCNICFFDRHQHCTIRMSKEAIHNLAQYLQEKLFQAKKLKAQLESWVSMFEGEISRVGQQADEMISYMTDMLQKKHALFKAEIEKIRESPSIQKMQDSCSECAELEDRLTVYLQELRWSSTDNYLVQPFLQSNAPSLHMPTGAELNSISLLKPVLQPNAFVVRAFLEMQNHSLGSVQLQCPVGLTSVDPKFATGNHLSGQNLSHKMENILEKCLPFLPLKLCVFGTITGDEFAHPDAVDSIVFLPNKCTLLSDPSNLKVKMVSFQGQRLGEVSFESSPNGLCLWKANVAATTVSRLKKIYFLNCENVLSVQSAVQTKKPYWGLAAGEIEHTTCLLAASSHSSSVDILTYDETMSSLTLLKSITASKLEKWGAVCNLCFTVKSCIIVADCFKSRIIGLNLEGAVLFDFPGHKDGLLKCPADVTADERYIYASDIGNNRILRLDHDGAFHGVVLTAQDGLLRPKGIDIDAHGHFVLSQFTEWPALLIFMTRF